MKKMILVGLVVGMLGCLAVGGAGAAVPRQINFQGVLTDAAGTPVTGAQPVTVTLYDSASGSTQVGYYSASPTLDPNGYFNVVIPITNAGFTFNQPCWVEVKLGSTPIGERVQLNSAAYALNADRLNGMTTTEIISQAAGSVSSIWQKKGTTTYYSAGRVGIGTSEPSSKLNVIGNVNIEGTTNLYGSIYVNGINAIQTTGALQPAANGLTIQAYQQGDNTTKKPIGLNPAGGSVGVGTLTPTATLDVRGVVKATSFVGDGSTLTGLPSNPWQATTGGIYYIPRVGIGTSEPATKLHVVGNLTADGTITGLKGFQAAQVTVDATYNGGSNINDNKVSRVSANSFQTLGTGVGAMYIEGSAIDSSQTIKIGMGNAGKQAAKKVLVSTLEANDLVKAARFVGDGSALTGLPTNPWTPATGGIAYNTGNVGIGSAEPKAKLDVNGTINAYAVNARVLTATVANAAGAVEGGEIQLTDKTGALKWFIDDLDAGLRIRQNGYPEQLFLQSGSGNVGIGTAAPSGALHVNAAGGENWRHSLKLTNTAASGDIAGGILRIETAQGTNPNVVMINAVRPQWGEQFWLKADGSAYFAGNVGVGTTPTNLGNLHIRADGLYGQRFLVLQNNNSWINLPANARQSITWRDSGGDVAGLGANYDRTANTVDLDFHSMYNSGYKDQNVVVMTVKGNGRVGIGTTAPSQKLHVAGGYAVFDQEIGVKRGPVGGYAVAVQGEGGFYHLNKAGTKSLITAFTASDTVAQLRTSTDTDLLLQSVLSSAYIRLHSNGKVGIRGAVPSSAAADVYISGNTEITNQLYMPNMSTSPTGTHYDVGIDSQGKLYHVTSSRKYKKDIQDLQIIPARVLGLTPRKFKWKESGSEDIGLIAEEVNETIPELVVLKNGQPEAVNYDKVAVYLLGVVKDQQKEINELKAKVDALEKK
ncbi:MAG: tail fiber domain-containing protein [Candidatus Margulisiibacteriota bacterium]